MTTDERERERREKALYERLHASPLDIGDLRWAISNADYGDERQWLLGFLAGHRSRDQECDAALAEAREAIRLALANEHVRKILLSPGSEPLPAIRAALAAATDGADNG